MKELDAPNSAGELYRARAEEVNPNRPLLTGDIFSGIAIPGIAEECEAAVITHPCSMRRGPVLESKLTVALVKPHAAVPLERWTNGYVRICPLPEFPGGDQAINLNDVGSVKTDALLDAVRVACMTPVGINLVQQRIIYNLTRFSAETSTLHDVSEAVFEEADLCEEWTDAVDAVDAADRVQAWAEFDAWLSAEDRRGQLADSQTRSAVRREMRSHLQ